MSNIHSVHIIMIMIGIALGAFGLFCVHKAGRDGQAKT